MKSAVALSGLYESNFPTWGRCFWQDPNDGAVFLAHTSGNEEVDYIYSTNSGVTWTAPQHLFACDDLTLDNNFDIIMDPRGHIHSVFKYRGSGCYQFTGRVAGGGYNNASGLGPVGFCLATDGASSSKGFHGSMFMSEGPIGIFGDPSVAFPAVRIVAKKADQQIEAWWLSHPFRDYPSIHSGILTEGEGIHTVAPIAGPDGGYPITTDAGQFGAQQITYNANNSSTEVVFNENGNWSLFSTVPVVSDVNFGDPGASGLLPFGPQMAFCSGLSKLNPVLISSASGIEMYTTYAEAAGDGNGFVRVDSTATYFSALGRKRRAPHGIPMGGHIPSGQVYGIGGQGLRGSGTLVDMSFTNSPNTLNIYYLAHNGLGLQCVNRIQCRMQRENSTNTETQYDFGSLSHVVSGVREFAPATSAYAGGNENTAHWKNFKALRHPTGPGIGLTKSELVCTIGSAPVYPSGFNFIVWNFNESVKGSETFAYPMYDYDYVATSGNQVSGFGGIYRTLKVTNPGNAFDRDNNTNAVINSGSSLTINFPQPTMLTRVELQTFGSSSSNRFPGAFISGSMDGDNWYHVHTMGSGHTSTHIKLSAENPQGADVSERIAPWTAKYLKFDFRQSQKRATTNYLLNELILFGPVQLMCRLPTSSTPNQTIITPQGSRTTERFTHYEGTLPNSDWSISGNFTWGVRASGDWSKISSLPNRPYPQSGRVGSGLFVGDSNGNGDGFSLKPNDFTPVNSSGLVQLNINVSDTELSSSGVEGRRTISFDYRTDFAGSDDRCDVYVSAFGATTEGTLIRRITTPNIDWNNMAFDVGDGNSTIKWIYTRGSTSGSAAGNTAQIWIDNLIGFNGPAQPSIGGFLNGDNNSVSGVIYGFMNSKGFTQIHAYMSGAPLYSTIHGVLDASPFESGVIHGYMSASMNEKIHGYMFGVGTEINSSINGVMGSTIPNSGSQIHAYMLGEGESNRIYGFLMAESGQMGSIYAYMNAEAFDSLIHGYMSAYGLPSGTVHGYLDGRNVNGSIFGYMGNNALAPSGGGTVAGGPGGLGGSTSGVSPTNWIHGYLKGEEASQFIHAFLEGPPGQVGSIYGYMPVGDNASINGFVHAALIESGNIHGYASGVGYSSSTIKGYMYGVSGIASSSIHGYLAGILTPSGDIYGFIIGIPDGVTSSGTCYSHGSIPIRPVTPATIPSGCFN